ncbi:glycosyltransferase family 4 protein [Verrucomicrobia bacterium]|nr:glycosyltransferase family 4 protein [Verrucomicrobiota bacterium]
MKIILVHQAFVSPHEGGGTRHFEFASHCQKAGHHFRIIASDLSYLSGQSVLSQNGITIEQDIDGVLVTRAKTLPVHHKSFFWRVISFLSFMCSSFYAGLKSEKVDIVMGTTPPIFQAVSAWAISKIKRVPFLLEVRDLWPDFAVDMGVLKNPVLIYLSKKLEKFLYAQAVHIIVNSPAYKDYLVEKHQIAASKVSLISNGVNPAMFDPNDDGAGIRKKLNIENKFVVTYAGAIGLANDIRTILSAAKILKSESSIVFLLVGDGKERTKMMELADEWGLENVIFTGVYPKKEMKEILAGSDLCLATLLDIPMFRKTYPNKVFDYMAAGRPTILGIDGVIRKVIEDADGGVFVQPGDGKIIAEKVMYFQQNPDRKAECGKNARSYVAKHFDRSQHAELFEHLINRIVSSNS